MKKRAQRIVATQTTGNIGLFYVCYRLSRLGWNVMPTARNAKGIDILAYSQKATRVVTIQVKALSKKPAVPFGGHLDNLFADFLVVCYTIGLGTPECSILTPTEARRGVIRQVKNGNASYWLPHDYYTRDKFRDKWHRIGKGT